MSKARHLKKGGTVPPINLTSTTTTILDTIHLSARGSELINICNKIAIEQDSSKKIDSIKELLTAIKDLAGLEENLKKHIETDINTITEWKDNPSSSINFSPSGRDILTTCISIFNAKEKKTIFEKIIELLTQIKDGITESKEDLENDIHILQQLKTTQEKSGHDDDNTKETNVQEYKNESDWNDPEDENKTSSLENPRAPTVNESANSSDDEESTQEEEHPQSKFSSDEEKDTLIKKQLNEHITKLEKYYTTNINRNKKSPRLNTAIASVNYLIDHLNSKIQQIITGLEIKIEEINEEKKEND